MEHPAGKNAERPHTDGSQHDSHELTIESVFIGTQGLRAGWRLLVYVAGFYFVTYAVSLLGLPLFALIPDGRLHDSYQLLAGDCIELIGAVIPALVLARLEQRPFCAYGLPVRQAFGKNFWVGALWGIVSLTVLLAIMRALGVLYFGITALHGVRLLKFATFWGLTFLAVAFYEEFITRGYTQFTLTDGIGFWPAAIVLSAIFGASHLRNPGENWHGALGAGIVGLFWCFTLRRTGTLWFGLGMHAAWDWGESFLYAVPDSGIVEPGHLLSSTFRGNVWLTGGSVGPEGSVLLFVIIAALWILFDRLYPEVKYKVVTCLSRLHCAS